MISIFAVERQDIGLVWPHVRPILAKVEKHNQGGYTLDEVKEDLTEGRSLLICVKDGEEFLACITCQDEPHPTKRVLHMPIVCGTRMREWLDLCHETIPRLAKERGYDMLITKGRRGWTKVLKNYGYKERYVSLGLEL